MDDREITIPKKLYDAFKLALTISEEDEDIVIKDIITKYVQKILNDSCQLNLNDDRNIGGINSPKAISKAKSRLPLWANRPHQVNHQIIRSFFMCEIDGVADREQMLLVYLSSNPDKERHLFENNLNSMATNAGNSHGKVFVIRGNEISITDEMIDTVEKFRKSFFTKEYQEVQNMILKKCPNCDLNYLYEGETLCRVCSVQEKKSHSVHNGKNYSFDEFIDGENYALDNIIAAFGCGHAKFRGMCYTKKTNSLVLFSGSGVYNDSWDGDVCYYTGEGLYGDQELIGQNLRLAESSINGVRIFLFEKISAGINIFRGERRLSATPYQEQQHDSNGGSRKVWIFPLKRN